MPLFLVWQGLEYPQVFHVLLFVWGFGHSRELKVYRVKISMMFSIGLVSVINRPESAKTSKPAPINVQVLTSGNLWVGGKKVRNGVPTKKKLLSLGHLTLSQVKYFPLFSFHEVSRKCPW